MLFAEMDGQQVIAAMIFLFIIAKGFQKMFSLVPGEVKDTAKESVIARIKRWGK